MSLCRVPSRVLYLLLETVSEWASGGRVRDGDGCVAGLRLSGQPTPSRADGRRGIVGAF